MPESEVTTPRGKIVGILRNGISIFKGIPYAEPPVGLNRWLPPQPLKAQSYQIQARHFGTVAPQNATGVPDIADFRVDEPQNEDCLFLNVWTPGLDLGERPVMVWIHGGAFSMGSGSQATFEASRLAQFGNVVVVTLNYRLGLLGFLNLNEVTDGKITSTGNEGLLDQIMALGWVAENISYFGGDPHNVTVFGESAGAMSTGCLLAMPQARHLFHKAILQSGAASTFSSKDSAVQISQQFLDLVGLRGRDTEALRRLSPEQILAAQQKLLRQYGMLKTTVPVIDDVVLPHSPLKCITSGSARGINVIAGTNRDEFRLFNFINPRLRALDENGLLKRCQKVVPEGYVSRTIEFYRDQLKSLNLDDGPADIWSAVQTGIDFRMPAIRLLEALCLNDQPAFSYLFTWESPVMGGLLGACHALEVGLVFANYNDNFVGSGPLADRLSAAMQDAWTSMAANGEPGCARLPDWSNYCVDRATMILNQQPHLETALFEDELQLWDEIEESR